MLNSDEWISWQFILLVRAVSTPQQISYSSFSKGHTTGQKLSVHILVEGGSSSLACVLSSWASQTFTKMSLTLPEHPDRCLLHEIGHYCWWPCILLCLRSQAPLLRSLLIPTPGLFFSVDSLGTSSVMRAWWISLYSRKSQTLSYTSLFFFFPQYSLFTKVVISVFHSHECPQEH